MKIDIFSDYACPYCFIGKKHLDKALNTLNIENVSIHHHVYLLEPGKISHPERTYREGLGKLSHEEKEHLDKTFFKITQLAKELQLDYHLDGILDISTVDAHRLTLWAEEFGLAQKLLDRIFSAHFIENLDISNHQVLIQLSTEIGLSSIDAKKILASQKYHEKIFMDDEKANELDIELIPHFIINDQHMISGIVNQEKLIKLLQKAQEI